MHPKTRLHSLVVSIAAIMALAGPATAVDGQKPINQSKANTGGVTPGDAPGFPVTISQSGSYVLTGNLTVPDENTTAIEITADDVTLDLNGFAILGPTVCSGLPLSCGPTGTGDGVFAAADVDNVSVVNGTIRGMGRHGVHLRVVGIRVERMHLRSNGVVGIFTGPGAMVTGNRVTGNGVHGIATDPGSVVSGNVCRGNGGTGILAIITSTVSGNTAISNAGVGIFAGNGSIVIGNAANLNTGVGLQLGSTAGYSQNVMISNNGGSANPQVLGGINGGQNVCGTDAVCP